MPPAECPQHQRMPLAECTQHERMPPAECRQHERMPPAECRQHERMPLASECKHRRRIAELCREVGMSQAHHSVILPKITTGFLPYFLAHLGHVVYHRYCFSMLRFSL